MLGRTANDLYWLSRYLERAENMARLVEVGYRLILMPQGDQRAVDHDWRSTLKSAGCEEGYFSRYEKLETRSVINYLIFDTTNSSSVRSCFEAARRNGRAQRTALTREMWESLNTSWIDLNSVHEEKLGSDALPRFLDWVKERSAAYRGAMLNTILRNDTFHFGQLGTFIERSDNTARILDVKYYVLLPRPEMIGGSVDSAQWATILRSVSAHRSYRWVYKETYKPWHVADFLILSSTMPRSLRSCYDEIVVSLESLERFYGTGTPCSDGAHATVDLLSRNDIGAIFQSGLHEFLRDFIGRNNRLGSEISEYYHFTG